MTWCATQMWCGPLVTILVNPWWGAATVMKGTAEAMLGNASRARILLESALPVTVDLPGFHAAALAHLALLDLAAGDGDGAVERSAAARTLADKYDLCDVVPMMVVYAVSAMMTARVGDLDGSREAIAITEKLLDRLGHLAARTALLGHGLLAWAAVMIGDSELVEQASRRRRSCSTARARCGGADAAGGTGPGHGGRQLPAADRCRAPVAALPRDPLLAAADRRGTGGGPRNREEPGDFDLPQAQRGIARRRGRRGAPARPVVKLM